MTNPSNERGGVWSNLIASTLALIAAIAAVFWFRDTIVQFLLESLYLNSVILAIFCIGVIFAFWRMARLQIESSVLDSARDLVANRTATNRITANDLQQTPRSFARERLLLYDEQRRRACPIDGDSHAEKIELTLSLHAGVTRYITGLLVFLGLLGTFIGLLHTIVSAEALVSGLGGADAQDSVAYLASLKDNLSDLLGGMSTAFTTSVFGLVTSLFVGFLHLQLSAAQTRFASRFELVDQLHFVPAFLAGGAMVRQAAAPGGQTTGAVAVDMSPMAEPIARYIEAAQRQMKDNLDRLMTIVERTEDIQGNFRDVILSIKSEIETTNTAISRLGTNQDLIREAMGKMVDAARAADENQRLALSHMQGMTEAIGRLSGSLQSSQQTNEDLMRDMIRALRQEIGAYHKAMTTDERGE